MSLSAGDRVRIVEGSYTGWEGEVCRVERDPPGVTVVITIFGRPTVIALRPAQIEPCLDGGTACAGQSDSPSDPDAPVRVPRRAGPGGRNSSISIAEPEDELPAEANAGNLVSWRVGELEIT